MHGGQGGRYACGPCPPLCIGRQFWCMFVHPPWSAKKCLRTQTLENSGVVVRCTVTGAYRVLALPEVFTMRSRFYCAGQGQDQEAAGKHPSLDWPKACCPCAHAEHTVDLGMGRAAGPSMLRQHCERGWRKGGHPQNQLSMTGLGGLRVSEQAVPQRPHVCILFVTSLCVCRRAERRILSAAFLASTAKCRPVKLIPGNPNGARRDNTACLARHTARAANRGSAKSRPIGAPCCTHGTDVKAH